jgi:hypothetical protein
LQSLRAPGIRVLFSPAQKLLSRRFVLDPSLRSRRIDPWRAPAVCSSAIARVRVRVRVRVLDRAGSGDRQL